MKIKLKNALTFGESVDVHTATDNILNLLDVTMKFYITEGTDTQVAHDEATNLIFSKPFDSLGGRTAAQWIAGGLPERKAVDALQNFVVETFKEANKVVEEQKIIMARVFSK